MRVLVNPVCNYGLGRKAWPRVEPALRRRFGAFDVEEIESPRAVDGQVARALEEGERVFIAAGGDGTVNLLLNALLNAGLKAEDAVLGAVGLGSSNDFHKPFRSESFVEGIPTRMEWKKAGACDVIGVRYGSGGGEPATRYCLVNASIGVTAEANALYNSRAKSIALAKRLGHEAAVIVSALLTIGRYKNIPAGLGLEGRPLESFRITNLGVIKNPHFAGGLCYDTIIRPDDGTMAVNLCQGMGKGEAVRALLRLYQKKFSGYSKTRSWTAREFRVQSRKPFALEMDGEVVSAARADFSILPGRMRCCP